MNNTRGSTTAGRRTRGRNASAQPFNNFSEREGGPNLGDALGKLFGDNETRWVFDTLAKATKHRESSVVAYRPELSWMRKATTSSQ